MMQRAYVPALVATAFLTGIAVVPAVWFVDRQVDAFAASRAEPAPVVWGDRFDAVRIPSTHDGTRQPAYVNWAAEPAPLVVSLHSWSGGWRQHDPLAELCADAGWNYLHPDFRGPNNRPEACASEAALSDIDDAIAYALEHGAVDRELIYVVGVSGGGHACCAVALNSRHPIRACYAWVPITDLAAWYHQCRNRGLPYADDILAVTGGDLGADARERSPLYMPLPESLPPLHLFAGIRDGYEGSTPISHSIRLYNRLCVELGGEAVGLDTSLALLSRHTREPVGNLGDRAVWLLRTAGWGSLTVFDGDHEILADACFAMLKTDSVARPSGVR